MTSRRQANRRHQPNRAVPPLSSRVTKGDCSPSSCKRYLWTPAHPEMCWVVFLSLLSSWTSATAGNNEAPDDEEVIGDDDVPEVTARNADTKGTHASTRCMTHTEMWPHQCCSRQLAGIHQGLQREGRDVEHWRLERKAVPELRCLVLLLFNCMLQSRGEELSWIRHPELGIPTNQSRQRDHFRTASCHSRRLGSRSRTSNHHCTHQRVTSLETIYIAATVVSTRSKQ